MPVKFRKVYDTEVMVEEWGKRGKRFYRVYMEVDGEPTCIGTFAGKKLPLGQVQKAIMATGQYRKQKKLPFVRNPEYAQELPGIPPVSYLDRYERQQELARTRQGKTKPSGTKPQDFRGGYREYTPAAIRRDYAHAGDLLISRGRVPAAVYAGILRTGFILVSPDLKLIYGAGYFGDNEDDGCIRQHMQPGVAVPDDKGFGIGTALYCGGVLAAIAKGHGNCTHSVIGDRSSEAETLWERLVEAGIATVEGGGDREGETELDISDDAYEAAIQDMAYSGAHGELENYRPTSVTIEWEASGDGVNYLPWDNIAESNRILWVDLDLFQNKLPSYQYDNMDDPEPVLPEVFAELDIANLPSLWLEEYLDFGREFGPPGWEDEVLEEARKAGNYPLLEAMSQLPLPFPEELARQAKREARAAEKAEKAVQEWWMAEYRRHVDELRENLPGGDGSPERMRIWRIDGEFTKAEKQADREPFIQWARTIIPTFGDGAPEGNPPDPYSEEALEWNRISDYLDDAM